MHVAEELRTAIRNIEIEAARDAQSAEKAEAQHQKAEAGIKTITESMTFWDKYLFGWFGDKQKITQRNELRILSESSNSTAQHMRRKVERAPETVDTTITQYLERNDETYRLLKKPYAAAQEMRGATRSFMAKIDGALSAIRSASNMETLDLFTKSKAISFMSSMENGSASSAIRRIKSAAPDFERAVRKYQSANESFRADHVHLRNVDDTLDLVTDLAFDSGLDFMSIFSLSALSAAESSVRGLKRKVQPIESAVNRAVQHTTSALNDYRRKVYDTLQNGAAR